MTNRGGIMSVLYQMWGLNLFITFYLSALSDFTVLNYRPVCE